MSNPSNCMQLDKSADHLAYQDEINKKLSQASSITHLLTAHDNHRLMSKEIVGNVLWAISDLLMMSR